MPKVHTIRKSRAGKAISCGKCQAPIEPGDQYKKWAFRYGGARYRCMKPECAPRPSDLTQSRMGEIWDITEAIDASPDTAEIEALADQLDELVEIARDVGQSYADAAEHFGGTGENQERADAIEAWLDSFDGKAEEIREAVNTITEAATAAAEGPQV